MASKDLSSLHSLDGAEPTELIRLDVDPTAKANFPRCAPDEADTVRVQALMDRRSPRLGPGQGYTTGLLSLLAKLTLMACTERLDDGRLHGKLNPVERDEPDNVPDPNDSDPTTRNRVDVRETPVSERSDDGRYHLRNDECTHERNRGAFHEEESVRTRDEDEGLRDDCHLEVRNHVQLRVVAIHALASRSRKLDAELVLEECGLDDDDNEDDAKSHVKDID